MLYLEIAGVSWVEIPSQLSVNLGANEKDHCAESAKEGKGGFALRDAVDIDSSYWSRALKDMPEFCLTCTEFCARHTLSM